MTDVRGDVVGRDKHVHGDGRGCGLRGASPRGRPRGTLPSIYAPFGNIPNVYLPQAETWVWETDGRVVGFISLLGNEVGAIFVDPDFQRTGIGQALMAQARALRGELEVEVFERNLQGRAFYAKLGFKFIHRRVHNETGFELMRLRLAANKPAGG